MTRRGLFGLIAAAFAGRKAVREPVVVSADHVTLVGEGYNYGMGFKVSPDMVNCDGRFLTLAHALDVAKPGDTIFLSSNGAWL